MMSALSFSSALLLGSDRYSKSLSLPDYLYDAEGNFDRAATRKMMLAEEYGFVRDEGIDVCVEVQKEKKEYFYAGKCHVYRKLSFVLSRDAETASFGVELFVPNHEVLATVVALDFSLMPERGYLPVEELLEMGLTIARVQYDIVSTDDNDFTTGIAPLLVPDRSDRQAAGKLAIWAYAANLVGKYLLEEGIAKAGALYVSGHSRLGKTALLTAALYEQFEGAHVNNSGCSGFAISREKRGETIAKICKVFPYWFAPAYCEYADREDEAPFDQHYLAALVAPRLLSVVTAEEDTWADTEAQYLCAEAASVIYEKCGVKGLDESTGMLTTPSRSTAGQIAFCMRRGTHCFSRDDWHFLVEVIREKQGK